MRVCICCWRNCKGRSFHIEEIPSSKQTYSSFRITIFVESAETALWRRERIGGVDGVLMLL